MTLQLTCDREGAGGPRRSRRPNRYPAVVASILRREWLAVLFAGSAVFAAVIAVVSTQPSQRIWGMFAAGAYGAACLVAVVVCRRPIGSAVRRRGTCLAVLVALGGAVLAPLAWLGVAGRAQPEVGVITRSAALFLHQGTPYAGAAALAAAHNVNAYDPYLPALIVFGMPHALFGGGLLTDPRLWFGVVFAATFGGALAALGAPRLAWWVTLVIASPLIAFPLAVGGDDLPVLGLLCLGLALAGGTGRPWPAPRWSWWERLWSGLPGRLGWLSRPGQSWPRPVAAGLILGLAAAMKATAWPALLVALALIWSRQGRRGAAWLGLAAAGVAVLADGPALARAPGAMVENTITYPLGLAKVASPAASVLPGHLMAATGSAGRWTAIALVLIAGLTIGIWLLVRPPADLHATGWRLVIGLTLLFLLAPASRAGYFVYPLGLSVWLLLTRPARTRPGDGTRSGRILVPAGAHRDATGGTRFRA